MSETKDVRIEVDYQIAYDNYPCAKITALLPEEFTSELQQAESGQSFQWCISKYVFGKTWEEVKKNESRVIDEILKNITKTINQYKELFKNKPADYVICRAMSNRKGDTMKEKITIDLSKLFAGNAKLDEIPQYIQQAKEMAGDGNEIVLTGPAPVWLYLIIAHALHGKAVSLHYSSPVTGELTIFNHNPY